jgi:hypothetical protein
MAFLKNLGQDMRNALLTQVSNDPGLKILLQEDKDVVGAFDNLAKETGETFRHLNKFGESQRVDLKDVVEQQAFYAMEVFRF